MTANRVFASVLVVVALLGGSGTSPASDPPAGRTDVVLTTDAPIREGRNVLWCATIQLAWDAAADAVGKDGRLEVGPPAPADVVAALNLRGFPHSDLDKASTLVVSGLVRDGVLERLAQAWKAKFPGEAPPRSRRARRTRSGTPRSGRTSPSRPPSGRAGKGPPSRAVPGASRPSG